MNDLSTSTRACFCPTCGQPTEKHVDRLTVDLSIATAYFKREMLELPRMEAIALSVLANAFPRGASREKLVDAMWGDRIDGGPEWTNHECHISRIRKKLKDAGWPFQISCERHVGYRLEFAP